MSNQNLIPVGTPVLVRARDAGVHTGLYQGHAGREVHLTESRRLWRWQTKSGITLSDIAVNGLNYSRSRVATTIPTIVIMDACEIIPLSDEAVASIKEAPVAQAA